MSVAPPLWRTSSAGLYQHRHVADACCLGRCCQQLSGKLTADILQPCLPYSNLGNRTCRVCDVFHHPGCTVQTLVEPGLKQRRRLVLPSLCHHELTGSDRFLPATTTAPPNPRNPFISAARWQLAQGAWHVTLLGPDPAVWTGRWVAAHLPTPSLPQFPVAAHYNHHHHLFHPPAAPCRRQWYMCLQVL